MKRRGFVKMALWALGASLLHPFLAFVRKERYRPPIEVRIDKELSPGQKVVDERFVLFMTRKGPIAVSRTCTHLGCRVNFMESEGIFLCPCHQSRFTARGRYLSGPARKDLILYEVEPMVSGSGFVVKIPRTLG